MMRIKVLQHRWINDIFQFNLLWELNFDYKVQSFKKMAIKI